MLAAFHHFLTDSVGESLCAQADELSSCKLSVSKQSAAWVLPLNVCNEAAARMQTMRKFPEGHTAHQASQLHARRISLSIRAGTRRAGRPSERRRWRGGGPVACPGCGAHRRLCARARVHAPGGLPGPKAPAGVRGGSSIGQGPVRHPDCTARRRARRCRLHDRANCRKHAQVAPHCHLLRHTAHRITDALPCAGQRPCFRD